MYRSSFMSNHSFNKRYDESQRIRAKYPDRVPIICEKDSRSRDIPDIDRKTRAKVWNLFKKIFSSR